MIEKRKLDSSELEAQLGNVPGWSVRDSKLFREFKFGSFQKAFGFMMRVAAIAEELQHHPEWFNVYDLVRVELATHDAGGVTALDFEFARRINRVFESSE